jgi:hypothetical protein
VSERHLAPRLLDADDRLTAAERLDLLAHVRVCAACRASWLATHPARIFALLALDAPSADDLDQLSSRVSAAIDRAGRPGGGLRRAWTSVAAAVVLAGLLGSYLWNDIPRTPRESAGLDVQPRAEAVFGEFELLSSPGTAEVYDMIVGDTHLVMIFDEALDL